MTKTAADVTDLLHRAADGSKEAETALFSAVYAELRQMARRVLRGERPDHSLQPTALVHEAYLRLVRARPGTFNDRTHFFAVAATVMRRILVDAARARRADKRGGLDPDPDALGPTIRTDQPEVILAIDTALTRLAAFDDRQARIVELRFFAGMTVEETAEALDVSPRTVKREWQLARAWLYAELQQ